MRDQPEKKKRDPKLSTQTLRRQSKRSTSTTREIVEEDRGSLHSTSLPDIIYSLSLSFTEATSPPPPPLFENHCGDEHPGDGALKKTPLSLNSHHLNQSGCNGDSTVEGERAAIDVSCETLDTYNNNGEEELANEDGPSGKKMCKD
ncbi:unnamed protein product [Eruca vesicaria subsp. sativa]|uniref:Uncharacterized protein n=1 Tax=Eruca vesicaria subsp. sativa TaxID=29727 RepID=A0ABC8J9B4_ERUVS|nr:unnamed protein product [Eruca vesicaria subsp. sativa]